MRQHVAEAHPLLRGAYSLAGNTIVTSGLGLVYWIVAARLFDERDLGRDAALIASLMLISSLCQLNLGNTLVRFLPTLRRRAGAMVLLAYGVSVALSLIVALGALFLAPIVSDDLALLDDEPLVALAYALGVGAWTLFALQDAALSALRAAHWVPLENAFYGVLKLAALPLALALGLEHGVLLAWVLPLPLLIAPVSVLLFRRLLPRHAARAAPVERPLRTLGRGPLARFLSQDFAASVLAQLGGALLPVVVAAMLGAVDNAYFYIPFTIVAAFDLLFIGVATSLTVEGAFGQERVGALVRLAVARFGIVLAGGMVVLIAGAHLVLLPFGADYADRGDDVLRLMALASLPRSAIYLYGAVQRLRGHGARILAAQGAVVVVQFGLLALLAPAWGLTGVGVAWLASALIVGLAVTPTLTRVLRTGDR